MKMKTKIILIITIFVYCFNISNGNETATLNEFNFKNIILTINENFNIKVHLVYEKNGLLLRLNDDSKLKVHLKDYLVNDYNTNIDKKLKEYLIDYRLIKDCKFEYINNGTRLENISNFNPYQIKFSVEKLENKYNLIELNLDEKINFQSGDRDKNSYLRIGMEFPINQENHYINIDKDKDNETDKTDLNKKISLKRLTEFCKERKNKIKNLKQELLKYIDKLRKNKLKEIEIENLLNIKSKLKNSIESYLNDSNEFLEEKNSLEEISINQINRLKILKDNSIKLRKNELKEQNFTMAKLIEVKKEIENKFNMLEIRNKTLSKLEDEIKSLNDELGNMNKELIDLQKNMLEIDDLFNKISNEKNSIEIEQKTNNDKKINLEKDIKSFEKNFNGNKLIILEDNKKLQILKNKKIDSEKMNQLYRNEIKDIDDKINELIKEKNKKLVQMKKNFDIIRMNDNYVYNIENEIEELNFKNKLIKIKINEKTGKLKDITNKSKFILNQKQEITRKFEIHFDDLNFVNKNLNKKIEEIDAIKIRLNDKKKTFYKLSEALNSISKEKNYLESSKSNLENDKSRLDSDLKNNELQTKNFEYEMNRLGRFRLSTFILSFKKSKNNNPTYEEYQIKKKELETEISEINKTLENLKLDLNLSTVNKFLDNNFIKEIPKSQIFIDLIKEDINNMTEDIKNLNKNNYIEKIKSLIQMIKN